MKSFTFYTPTRIYFGEDAESHIGEDLKSRGATKVLIHYGSDRIIRNGLMAAITGELDKAGIAYVSLGGVEPNPKIGLIRRGVELARKEGVDFLLAVGGGSAIDSTKGIRLGLSHGVDPWEALTKGMCAPEPFPMGVVLTMAAAGSEMSNSAVITNDELGLKRGSNNDANRPDVAFMNPLQTLSTPPYQTAAGITDIMMHTMERFLTNEPDTPLTDAVALAILNTVKEQGRRIIDDPSDIDARSEIMWASTIAHNNLTELGRAKRTFTAHKIEHDLSGAHDSITHGAGLAVIFPAWCLAEAPYGPKRFAYLMRGLWETEAEDDMEAVREGVANMRAYFKSIGMPTTMGELGIDPSEYDMLSGLTTNGGTAAAASFRGPLTQKDIIEIYRLAE